jgi:hypothetical protein
MKDGDPVFWRNKHERSGSHPSQENQQIIISIVLIRRGGALSWRWWLSFLGVWGSQPPLVIPEKANFHGVSPVQVMIAHLTPALPPLGAGAYYDAPALPEREISP